MNDNSWRVSPILGVQNVRQAAEYYRDVLGFSLDPEQGVFQPTQEEPGGVYAIVKRPEAWIHFQIRRGELPARKRAGFERDVYIYVHGLDALHDDLMQRGANIVAGPQMTGYGIREIEVEDLNGYRLTFGEML